MKPIRTFLPLFLAFAAPAQGAVLALFPFSGGSTTSTAAASPGLTVSIFNAVEGGVSSSSNMAFMRADDTANTLVGAVAASDSFEFSLTVAQGYAMDLTSLSFDHLASADTLPGVTYPYDSSLSTFTSLGGFAAGSELSTSTASIAASTGGAPTFLRTETIPLLATALGGTTSIRVYGFDNQSATSNPIVRLDNLNVEGLVYRVPEPSRALLLALGGLFIAGRRGRS